MTAGCIKTATDVLNDMQPAVEPCDDFYKFVCGGYNERQVIPDNRMDVTRFSDNVEQMDRQLRWLLEDPTVLPTDVLPIQQVKHLYGACKDVWLIADRGLTPLMYLISEMGGWPLLMKHTDTDKSGWTWQRSVSDFRRHGFSINYFMSLSIDVDDLSKTQMIINVRRCTI